MTPWLDDGDVRLYHGDALAVLRDMPSESVHCAITSPPFYSLRDYGVDGQIGLEDSLDGWLEALVAVFGELKRVLRSDGTFWCEIGDTYIDKQLAGAPWRLAFALQEAGWFLRSDCIWARLCPNPMPESVTDRPTKSHSYLFLLSKQARYYFDSDAIREPHTPDGRKVTTVVKGENSEQHRNGERWPGSGRNARSVQTWATQPTPFQHFATFPEALVAWCIKAGTSEHGCCSECGAPWRRITEVARPDFDDVAHRRSSKTESGYKRDANGVGRDDGAGAFGKLSGQELAARTTRTHVGWEHSCPDSCEAIGVKPCVVLDPFMGSGTTALVARRLGRRAIGVELNLEYLGIAAKRLEQLSLLA